MSTKKKETVCAGCEKRDATIKRQAEEYKTAYNECVERGEMIRKRTESFKSMKALMEYWHSEYRTALDTIRYMEKVRDDLSSERVNLQSRIDSFKATCADIRAVCVDAGIEHADKMATLTAVKALAENANRFKATHDGVRNLMDSLTTYPRTMKISLHPNGVRWETVDDTRPDCWRIAIPRIHLSPCERPVFFIALFTAICAWGVFLAAVLS